MQFKTVWVNQAVSPVYLLKRQLSHGDDLHGNVFARAEIARVGEFWVPQNPALLTDWSVTTSGEFVRVPIFPYRVPRALSALWAMGLQLGMTAVAELGKFTSAKPEIVYLIIGSECEDLYPVAEYRCHVGIAISV